ncbi:MAG: serine/threonine protein phosphatase [Symploca sp. SIO3C6]|nr:serine/threonine protein phosphatase [Symploca sp. SIO3C6]
MENPAAKLTCPNPSCQAPNPQNNKFCDQCRTPLLKRYLWVLGSEIGAYKCGKLIADRYLLVHQRIVLDTKPTTPPQTPQEIPPNLAFYLRLSPYKLHIPQIYGSITTSPGEPAADLWLLEAAPLVCGNPLANLRQRNSDTQVQLLPKLISAWQEASALRQLNWWWQIACLWQPLSAEGVASSLLNSELLRVEDSIIRLLELQPDNKVKPTLKQLGELWSQLSVRASPVISSFCQQLCTQLKNGQIKNSEQLVALLDQGLFECGQSQSRAYEIFTLTDTGPSRNHNEDACYPPHGQLCNELIYDNPLAIVCDGIGGHEGGEVASGLAIKALQEKLEKLPAPREQPNPITLTLELERAVCSANDIISQQNDSEHRSERQRMGTTLVMALANAHQMYITHVGDSRVYWITRSNCHQVTQDDDLASREVRLGYTLYRNAIQHPTSGSLVQALGMAASATLHPTVQRFCLDEDSIFLLCSDGLSDNDLVEQYWQTTILPILAGQIDLKTAGSRLIEIANSQNGHDNVTIALVYCQVTPLKEIEQKTLSLPQRSLLPAPSTSSMPTTAVVTNPSGMKTRQLPAKDLARFPWGLILGIFLLLGLGSLVTYVLLPGVSRRVDLLVQEVSGLLSKSESIKTPVPLESPSPNPRPSVEVPLESPSTALAPIPLQVLVQVKDANVPLWKRKNESVVGIIPAGSILQVTARSQDNLWLRLKVCSGVTSSSGITPKEPLNTPSEQTYKKAEPTSEADSSQPVPASGAEQKPLVKPGDVGWLQETEVQEIINPNFTRKPTQSDNCSTTTAPVSLD